MTDAAISGARRRLESTVDGLRRVAVATSGGVDSMTLAVVAHRRLGDNAEMVHAVSPAVPPEATATVRAYARREGWRLRIIDAGEFDDESYVANPANRCYFCKANLYAAVASLSDALIVSGTNLDDLGDYRPGLEAARELGVRHPYVEAKIDKAMVRGISRTLRLDDLAELPAAPCLSSRIETGIAIEARMLSKVHRVERMLRRDLGAATARARVRSSGVVIELDAPTFAALSLRERDAVIDRAAALWDAPDTPVSIEPYRQGSAFIR